jgi:hypothetical protein
MGVQRYVLPSGAVRYRARVKSHGRYVATRVFERKGDAVVWEQDQRRRLRLGEWIDPRRGRVPLSVVAADWLGSRGSVKRRTWETDEAAWRNYIGPRFGNWPVASITAAEVSGWVGSLVVRGLAPSTATRALATLRSVLAFAVADGRVQHNVAAVVRKPTSGRARREGQALTLQEVWALTEACKGRYRDVVPVLALAGLRWGELAGLQVADRVVGSWSWLAVAPCRAGKWWRRRPVRGHVEEQPGPDGAAGPGPAADRGSLGRREGAGCVALRRTARRPAAGVELETLGGLERGDVGCRCPRLPRS